MPLKSITARLWQEYIPNWSGIVDSDFSDRLNDVRIIGCTTVVLILVLAFVGMDWVTRVSTEGVCGVFVCDFRNFKIDSL